MCDVIVCVCTLCAASHWWVHSRQGLGRRALESMLGRDQLTGQPAPPRHSLPAGMWRPSGVPSSPSCFYQSAQLGKDQSFLLLRSPAWMVVPCFLLLPTCPTRQKTKSQNMQKKWRGLRLPATVATDPSTVLPVFSAQESSQLSPPTHPNNPTVTKNECNMQEHDSDGKRKLSDYYIYFLHPSSILSTLSLPLSEEYFLGHGIKF